MTAKHLTPSDIERTSMSIITDELEVRGIRIPDEHLAVVKRVIHTTADFDYADNLCFTPGAVSSGIAAISAGRTIITDTNMGKSGINRTALEKTGVSVDCFMSLPEIAESAKRSGTTRAVASVIKAFAVCPDAIFAVGNAPTALFEIARQIENGFRPSLVIGVPVGFVNVVEAKELIFETCLHYGVPAIVSMGRKGGSNVAAAICNALLYSAGEMLDPAKRGWN